MRSEEFQKKTPQSYSLGNRRSVTPWDADPKSELKTIIYLKKKLLLNKILEQIKYLKTSPHDPALRLPRFQDQVEILADPSDFQFTIVHHSYLQ